MIFDRTRFSSADYDCGCVSNLPAPSCKQHICSEHSSPPAARLFLASVAFFLIYVHCWMVPSVNSTFAPRRIVQLRPPGRWRASSTVQSKPALRISYGATSPAIPAPRITTVVPRPTFGGISKGVVTTSGLASRSIDRTAGNAAP